MHLCYISASTQLRTPGVNVGRATCVDTAVFLSTNLIRYSAWRVQAVRY